MFIAALVTIAKTWKEPKCPLMDEWIKKISLSLSLSLSLTHTHTHTHTHTQEHYSAIKKNRIKPFSATYVTRDDHTKWSKSERERQIPYDITYMWNLKYNTNEPHHGTDSWT